MSKKSQVPNTPLISGQLIARARLARKWRQEDLAKKAGVSRTAILYQEHQQIVSRKFVPKMDAAFGGVAWRQDAPTESVAGAGAVEEAKLMAAVLTEFQRCKELLSVIARRRAR